MSINTKHLSAVEWLKTKVNVYANAGTEAQKCKNPVFGGTVNKLFQEQAK